jgi:hypothetical protein
MRWSPITIVLPLFFFTTSTTAYPVSATLEGALAFVRQPTDLRQGLGFDCHQEGAIAKRTETNCDKLQDAEVLLRGAKCQEVKVTHNPHSFDCCLVKRLNKVTSQHATAFIKDQTAPTLKGNDHVSSRHPN